MLWCVLPKEGVIRGVACPFAVMMVRVFFCVVVFFPLDFLFLFSFFLFLKRCCPKKESESRSLSGLSYRVVLHLFYSIFFWWLSF